MASSAAERQRRSRAHRRGDHALCDPKRCDAAPVTADVTSVVTRPAVTSASTTAPDGKPRPPSRLRARGQRLWRQLVDEGDPGPGELVLIEEACRLADRCDRLDAIVNGADRAWLKLELSDDGTQLTVVVDKLLSEARQQQLALKQVLAELRQAAGGARSAGAGRQPQRGAAGATPGGNGGGVTDLAARIAAKRSAQTAG